MSDLVRPFVMTGGRTRAADASLRMETMVQTVLDAQAHDASSRTRASRRCARARSRSPRSRPKLGVPLGVAMVFVGDLVAEDRLVVHHSDPVDIELSVLTRMIDRVRTL